MAYCFPRTVAIEFVMQSRVAVFVLMQALVGDSNAVCNVKRVIMSNLTSKSPEEKDYVMSNASNQTT